MPYQLSDEASNAIEDAAKATAPPQAATQKEEELGMAAAATAPWALGGAGVQLGAEGLLGLTGLESMGAQGLGMYGLSRATGHSPMESLGQGIGQALGVPIGRGVSATAGALADKLAARHISKALGGPLEEHLAPGGATALAVGRQLGIDVPPQFVAEGSALHGTLPEVGGLTRAQTEKIAEGIQQKGSSYILQEMEHLPPFSKSEAADLMGSLARGDFGVQYGQAKSMFDWVDDQLTERGLVPLQAQWTGETFGHPPTRLPVPTVGTPTGGPIPMPGEPGMEYTAQGGFTPGGLEMEYRVPEGTPEGKAVNFQPVLDKINELAGQHIGEPQRLPSDLTNLLANDGSISYGKAHRIRAQLSSRVNAPPLQAGDVTTYQKKLIGEVNELLGTQIQKAVDAAPPEVGDVLRHANYIWSEEVQGRYQDGVIKKLMNENPDDVRDWFYKAEPTEMKSAYQILQRSDPDAPAKLQGAIARDIIQSTRDPSLGVQSPVDSKQLLDRYAGLHGTDAVKLNSLLPPGTEGRDFLENARQVGILMRMADQRAASGVTPQPFGSRMVGYLQHRALWDAMKLGAVGAGAHSLGAGVEGTALTAGGIYGGILLKRALTSKTATNFLKMALVSQPGSQAAARGMVGSLQWLLNNNQVPAEMMPRVNAALKDAQERAGVKPDTIIRQSEPEAQQVEVPVGTIDSYQRRFNQ